MLEESLTIKPSSDQFTRDVGCVEAHCPDNLLGKRLFKDLDLEIWRPGFSRQALLRSDASSELHLIGVSRVRVTFKVTPN